MSNERKVFAEVNAQGETVKVSQKELFNRLLKIPEIAENDLYREFIEYRIELINRKSATGSKTQNTQNIELAETLYNLLKNSNAETTISQILQTSDFSISKGYSPQKISALLKILIADGRVEKIVIKRVNYYKAVEVAE